MLHLFFLINIIIHSIIEIQIKSIGGHGMKKIVKLIGTKGRIVLVPILLVSVLASIFIFNGYLSGGSAIIANSEGTFIQASGMVEKNSITLSSEIIGTIDEVLVKEGEKVTTDQIIAKLNNTNINNQYEQALIAIEIADQNIKSIEDSLAGFGLVNANSIEQAKSAYIAAEGELEKILEGASAEEIYQAEEAVSQAKTNLDFIESSLEKSKILLESGAMPQVEYDEVELNYNIALAQYNTVNSKLSLIKKGPSKATIKAIENKMLQSKSGYELTIANGNTQILNLQNQLEMAKIQLEQSKTQAEQLEKELDKSIIKSPIDGIVNLLNVRPGELTQPGKGIVEIYDPNDVEINVYISEANIGYIKLDQDVEIFVDSDESRVFYGKVIKINDNAEFTPKNVQTKEERVNTVFGVKIGAIDSQGVIKSGMPVDVNIKTN